MKVRLRRHPREQGSASVLLLSFIATLIFVGAALGVVAALVRVHRTAAAAADLAALAGAQALARGADGCTTAQAIAQLNAATVTSCQVDERDVVIIVTARGPRWLGQTADLTAEARAGPR